MLCERPHVLVGDLNAAPWARELHPLRKVASNHRHMYEMRSFPARMPIWRYDHVWPGLTWSVERIETLPAHVSDHRPVLARLRAL
jgi:endonuclease/exonuclease/phosphatase (EEP) superfamily protein YafD